MLSILFDLPFSDKKQLVESVISPESGGKVYVRTSAQMNS
jgi:hypothetical protein